MSTIGTVSIDLEARLAKFESDMGRAARIAEQQMEKTRKAVDSRLRAIDSRMASFGANIASAVKGALAAFSVGALAGFAHHIIDVADNIKDLSKTFGVSVEALSVWRLSAEKSGTSLEGIAKSAKFLTKDLDGTEVKLKSMGIAFRDATGNVRPIEQVMEDVARKFATYKDTAERTTAATALLGKAGADQIPWLVDFGKNVEAARAKTQALGVDFTAIAGLSDDFNDNLRDSKAVAEGFAIGVLAKVLPALNDWIGADIDLAEKHGGLRKEGELLGKQIADSIDLVRSFTDAIRDLVGQFETLIALEPGVGGFLSGTFGFLKGVGNLFNPFAIFKNIESGKATLLSFLATLGLVPPELHKTASAASDVVDPIMRAAQQSQLWGTDLGNTVNALAALDHGVLTIAPHLKTQADLDKGIAERTKAAAEALADWTKLQKLHDAELMKADDLQIKHRQHIDEINRSVQDARDELEFEGRQIGLNSDAQELNAKMRQLVQQFTDKETGAIEESAKAFLAEAPAIIASNQAKAEADRITRLFVPTEVDAARQVAQSWGQASHSISETLAGALTGAFDSFKDFGKSMLNIAKKLIADLIAEFLQLRVIGPMMHSLLNSTGGAGGGLTGLLGGAGGGIVGLAGLGGLGLLANGAQTGNRGSGALGGALLGGAFASTAFGAGLIGSGLGAAGLGAVATGALAGSVVPIVGTLIGAAVGLIIASFHKAPKPPEIQVAGIGAGIDRVEASGTSAFGAVRVNTVGSGQQPSADVLNAITQFDAQIASILNPEQVNAATARLASFEVDLTKGAATIENVLGQRWQAILSTFPEDIQAVVAGAGDLQAQVQKLGEVLQFPAQLAALLSQLGTSDMLAGMSDFEQQVFALNAQFDQYVTQAAAWGATEANLAQIEAYRASALGRLEDAQNGVADAENVAAQAAEEAARRQQDLNELLNGVRWDDYLGGLSDFDRQMAELHKRFRDIYDQAVSLGAGERELNVIRDAEARAIDRLQQSAQELIATIDPRGSIYQPVEPIDVSALEGPITQLINYLNGLGLDQAVTTLTPQEQLRQAQEQYEALLGRARNGDADAISGLSGAAQDYLTRARSFYASGDIYQTIFDNVESALRGVVQAVAPDRMAELVTAATTYLPSIDAHLEQIAASFGSLASYDTGTSSVPYDQLAMVHEGEAILDVKTAGAFRNGIKVAGSGDGSTLDDRHNAKALLEAVKALVQINQRQLVELQTRKTTGRRA